MENLFKIEQEKRTFTIPKWTKIAKTYNKAVEKAFIQLSKERKFYNYCEGNLGKDYLRESDRKKEMMKKLYNQKGHFISFPAQLGEKYKGKSVREARKMMKRNEFGLGAYEIACILINNPDILTKYEDLWIDCAGDEYAPVAGGDFSRAPYFCFVGGGVKFASFRIDFPVGICGSVSGFVPQS